MKVERNENRSQDYSAGMPRGAGSISPIRRERPSGTFCSTRTDRAPRAGIPQEGRSEPKPARAETEGQAIRFPRPCRLEDFCRFSHLAGEFGIGHALADDSLDAHGEALGIVHLPIVVAERLFVNVPEQVKRLDAHVGAFQSALEQAPEVLHSVGMDLPVHIGLSVIDDRVSVFVQPS